MNNKHLFFAIHEYSGANTYARQLQEHLAGHESIRLYIIHFGSMHYPEFTVVENGSVTLFHFPFPGKRNLDVYSRRVVDLLTPWLKDKEDLILHLNSPNQHFLGQQVKERFGAKVVVTIHFLMNHFTVCTDDYTYENDSFQDCSGNKETIQLSDRVICVTRLAHRVTELYFKKEKEQIELIYNGYGSAAQIKPLSHTRKIALKKELGFSKDEIIILYVGRIDETKGCERLIQAMDSLLRTHNNVRLLLAGSGNYGESLKFVGLNGVKISFTGHLPAKKLKQLYHIADIGVIPSLWEQCSYVAIEMMAHALPVVYSGVPGLRELFIHGVNGWQIPFHRDNSKYKLSVNSKDIEDALNELITNPRLIKKLGKQARETWKQKFTGSVMGQQMLELYQKL